MRTGEADGAWLHGECVVRASMTHLVLDLNAGLGRDGVVNREVVVSLLQREEPDDGADDQDDEGINDQEPVQHNKTGRVVVLLHHGTDGDHKC